MSPIRAAGITRRAERTPTPARYSALHPQARPRPSDYASATMLHAPYDTPRLTRQRYTYSRPQCDRAHPERHQCNQAHPVPPVAHNTDAPGQPHGINVRITMTHNAPTAQTRTHHGTAQARASQGERPTRRTARHSPHGSRRTTMAPRTGCLTASPRPNELPQNRATY